MHARGDGTAAPTDPETVVEPTTAQALEAILFVVDDPVDATRLAEVLEVPRADVERELQALAATYERDGRGLAVRNVAGGWRLYTAPVTHEYVERFVATRAGKLSSAALETLAVIAYRQPITRQLVGDIRGVDADGPIRTLVRRGLVAEVGREDAPGQAMLFGTTARFLEELGLTTLDDLPELTGFLPESPAPDEPAPDGFGDARRRLAAGEDLPTTRAGAAGAVAEVDELSESLDHAARAAMDHLRRVIAAAEDADPDGASPDAAGPGSA